jgi:hypothetical protein
MRVQCCHLHDGIITARRAICAFICLQKPTSRPSPVHTVRHPTRDRTKQRKNVLRA